MARYSNPPDWLGSAKTSIGEGAMDERSATMMRDAWIDGGRDCKVFPSFAIASAVHMISASMFEQAQAGSFLLLT